jgi:hypothetical protein
VCVYIYTHVHVEKISQLEMSTLKRSD